MDVCLNTRIIVGVYGTFHYLITLEIYSEDHKYLIPLNIIGSNIFQLSDPD